MGEMTGKAPGRQNNLVESYRIQGQGVTSSENTGAKNSNMVGCFVAVLNSYREQLEKRVLKCLVSLKALES